MLQHEDRRHTVEEGRKILEIAARLQDADSETISSLELEQAAAELGIDPTFVRRAIAQQEHQKERRGLAIALRAMAAFLVVAQWLAAFTAFTGEMTQWQGAHLWFLAALSFALGAVTSTSRSRWVATASLLASFLVVGALCGGWVRITGGEIGSNWPAYLRNLALLQVILALVGGLLGEAGKHVGARNGAHEPSS